MAEIRESSIVELCGQLQASVQSCANATVQQRSPQLSSAAVELELEQQLITVQQLAERLGEAASLEATWQEHRSHILTAVAQGLAEPACLKVIVRVLRQFVYPAALLLLSRVQAERDRLPLLFERVFYAMSHLVHEPSLREPILEYLRSAPPVFCYALRDADAQGGVSTLEPVRCRFVCESTLRLLTAHVACLRCLWDWHRFTAFCAHPDAVVQQLSFAAIAQLVGLRMASGGTSEAVNNLLYPGVEKPVLALPCWHMGETAFQMELLPHVCDGHEMAQVSSATNSFDGGSWQEDGIRAWHGVCFQASLAEASSCTPFVATPPAMNAMRGLLLGIGTGKPVLVSGAPGVGKTAFLRKAAELFGQREPVFLYCDEQTDIKLLLGTYACGKLVGEFVWKPGVVTEALRQGRWLVLEDVDRVPAEILAALLPLADSRRLTLPDRNQTIQARLGFHLFGTLSINTGPSSMLCNNIRASEEETCVADEGGLRSVCGVEFPGRVPTPVAAWTRVHVPTPFRGHLAAIISGLYPELQSLIPQFLASAAALGKVMQSTESTSGGGGTFTNTGVVVGLRELLCWCDHLRHARLTLNPIFTEESRTTVLREASVVLLARVPDAMHRRELLARIAPTWGLACGIAEALLEERPGVEITAKELKIGNVILKRAGSDDSGGAPFAYTSVHARVLQALASSIRCDKPVLLVGDTGTGKTSVVQHLGELLCENVLVYNFSEQSESSELIGGFRPVDVVLQSMTELNVAFSAAFKQTFSRRKNGKLLERAHHEFVARRWSPYLQVIGNVVDKALQALCDPVAQSSKGVRATHQTSAWQKVRDLCSKALATIAKGTAPHFEFQEGLLVQALRSGAWVVLDEINLAPGDILQRIQGLIERSPGTQLALPESGDEHIIPHKNFRIFACMNPPRVPTGPLLFSADASMGSEARNDAAGEEASAVPGFRAGHSAGKKELPPGIRARFTEIFVDEVRTTDDVARIVRGYLERNFPSPPVEAIVKFYAKVKLLAHECVLLDGSGKVAHFSLRNLTRALRFSLCAVRRPCHPTVGKLALAQGLAVGFATPLDRASAERIEGLIEEALGVSAVARCKSSTTAPAAARSKKIPNAPEEMANVQADSEKGWVCVEGYWIKAGPCRIDVAAAHHDFVITASVRHHLQNIARMLSGGRFPVLLEGPTSSGKTSLVKFVAKLTGHECVRINNHEHTDLQEYLGQYVCDPATGQLVFQEGVLARAARAGQWVVLDELNLAPSEVLEALNRLLDDNRELFIADTGETIKPHEDFMVFATQNPAGGLYGGRKLLSRAFRNRFTEGFINELPMEELGIVLHRRCEVPPSFVKAMLAVYQDLQSHRCQTAVFQGKQSFMTVRDLLRWGNRKPGSQIELAVEGFALLAERLRKDEDRQVVRRALQKHCPGAKSLQTDYPNDPFVIRIREQLAARLKAGETPPNGVEDIVWTPAFCRMCALIGRCVQAGESALLIGETGGGKTMACQVLSWLLVEQGEPSRQLRILNCHQQTETSDFIGSLRPVRGREALLATMSVLSDELLTKLNSKKIYNEEESERSKHLRRQLELFSEDSGSPKQLIQSLRMILTREPQVFHDSDAGAAELTAPEPEQAAKRRRTEADDVSRHDTSNEPLSDKMQDVPEGPAAKASKKNGTRSSSMMLAQRLLALCARWEQIFEWADGALVQAMRSGGAFLIDEISLADDSVLERLNSVLEPECTLLLAEKPLTSASLEVVQANASFRLFATMNPGGDFGKRELSPALRNRFTEIWVEPIDFAAPEAEKLLASQLAWPVLAKPMLRAVMWFNERVLHPLTIREVLAWASFVTKASPSDEQNDHVCVEMYVHGGCMTLVDSLGLGNRMTHSTGLTTILQEKTDVEARGCLTPHQYTILQYLVNQVDEADLCEVLSAEDRSKLRAAFGMGGFAWVRRDLAHDQQDAMECSERSPKSLCIGPFSVPSAADTSCAGAGDQNDVFDFSAPSTACNVGRLVRSLQQPKAVLLEGPPGLGKTATVQALAKATNRRLLRINLSEQTDLMDLLGSDLPTAGSETVSFKWCDGALLRAMKAGDWVLLDEINLAPQATLEGLNALLDHRREVFLPAIGQTVSAHPGFRIFAAQNPVSDGGGRKGLPRSFLNRFTRVILTSLSLHDLRHICQHCYSKRVDSKSIDCAVDLVEALRKASTGDFGDSPPFEGYHDWDWNLRDALRLCELLQAGAPLAEQFSASAELLFVSRLRSDRDKDIARALIERVSPAAMETEELPPEASFKNSISVLRSSTLGHLGCGEITRTSAVNSTENSVSDASNVVNHALAHLQTSQEGIQIGTACIPRKMSALDVRCWSAVEHAQNAANLTPLPCQMGQLHAIAHAMSPHLCLPVLLVGAPASGKRSSIQWLASAVGMPLQEVPLTPSLDASELLGCFEQMDGEGRLRDFVHRCRQTADALLRIGLLEDLNTLSRAQFTQRVTGCHKQCAEVEHDLECNRERDIKALVRAAENILTSLVQCMRGLRAGTTVEHWGTTSLKDLAQKLETLKARSSGSHFEWVDGPLVTALLTGSWVLLSHAEHAAPAVLDRLNSVLEPNGFLLLTESGEERLIRPHPDFRVFFTMTVGNAGQQISRALRNRCLEIFVGFGDHVAQVPKSLESQSAAKLPLPLDFLVDALQCVVKLVDPSADKNSDQGMQFIHNVLAPCLAGEDFLGRGSPIPSPAFLVDSARVLAARAPLGASVVLHMAVLHTVSHSIWCYLRDAITSQGRPSAQMNECERDSYDMWVHQLMLSNGFTWRSLQKFVDLFVASVSRQVHMSRKRNAYCAVLLDNSEMLEQSYLQIYVAEVCGGQSVAQLFLRVFKACSTLPGFASFRWLAEAAQLQPRSMQLVSPDGIELCRQLQPLHASAKQGAGDKELLTGFHLFLERTMLADVDSRLQQLSKLGDPFRNWSQSARAYFSHPLLLNAIPTATAQLRELAKIQHLHSAKGPTIQDAWRLVNLTCSVAGANIAEIKRKATHLQELLRCARALASHTQWSDAVEVQAAALDFSRRFQNGSIPMSQLPHPILAVAQPLIDTCALGFVEALSSACMQDSHQQVLPCIRLGMSVVQRARNILGNVAIGDDKKVHSWTRVEARVLCLFQQLYRILEDMKQAPWLERAHEHLRQLRVHLRSAALSWDPDTQRLQSILLPLTDAMSAWGGLDAPLRSSSEFLLEQLLLGITAGTVPHRIRSLPTMSGLLAAMRIRQQSDAGAEQAANMLMMLLTHENTHPDIIAEGDSTGTSVDSGSAKAHHAFLVLEAAQMLHNVAATLAQSAATENDVLLPTISHALAEACEQLQLVEKNYVGTKGGGLARCALTQAVAEIHIVEWVLGGKGPWHLETQAGLPSNESTQRVQGPAQHLSARSILAICKHVNEALANAFVEDTTSSQIGLMFTLSPATLTRLKPSWSAEAALPAVASLLLRSGFKCAWALNLSTTAVGSTTMGNHQLHVSHLESLLDSCMKSTQGNTVVNDWAILLNFLSAQFHGLQKFTASRGSRQDAETFSKVNALLASCRDEFPTASAETLSQLHAGVLSLKASVQRIADGIAQEERPTFANQWPMPFPALVESFIAPVLDLLAQRCTPAEGANNDAAIRGAVSVGTAMWRLHSGGGMLVPGGLDSCEAAAQLRADLQEQIDHQSQELAFRTREELAVDGRWACVAGAIADISCEAKCMRDEIASLDELCRLRPPLSEEPCSQSVASLPIVSAVCPGQTPPGYQELCQEIAAFSTSIARPERIFRLVASLRGLPSIESESMVLSELQNLATSAFGFMQRVQMRFPLHADLVAPVVLAIHLLLHGLYLVHEGIWHHPANADAANADLHDLGTLPQSPAFKAGGPSEILGDGVQESHPEILSWWLRWTTVLRRQQPLTAPHPAAVLELLRTVSRQIHDDEEKQALEEVQKEAPYKMAKSMSEALAEQEDEDEMPELFPGVDQEEIAEMLGLQALEERIRDTGDGGGDEMQIGGGSLYDLWAKEHEKAPGKIRSGTADGTGHRRLDEYQLVDLCTLSLEAFGSKPEFCTSLDLQVEGLWRAEALDASLELFVRHHVAQPSVDGIKVQSVVLPAEKAKQLLPLVMLRIKQTINQLLPSKHLANVEDIGLKRTAQEANRRQRLHGDAACDFYAESNPGILLQLAAPLRALRSRIGELLKEYEAHPTLLALEGIAEKMLHLRLLQTTPMVMVTMLEVLLGRAASWEEVACKGVSLAPQLRPLEALTVGLRERQLLEWKSLRQARERHWERQGAKWWFHLIGLLTDVDDPRTLVDELLRFIRTSTLAQFKLRMRMLSAAAHLHRDAEGSASLSGRIATHVYHYASKWVPIIGKSLTKAQEIMEKEVQDLVKIVRWDLSNYQALKESVTRSHKQLAKVIKRFDEALQELADFQLVSAAITPNFQDYNWGASCSRPAMSSFMLPSCCVEELQGRCRNTLGDKEAAERVSDNEAFWKESTQVWAALPSMLRGLRKVVSQHFLSETFCFAAPGGHGILDLGKDLCSEIMSVHEALQDESNSLTLKRRRLQSLREECARFSILPRPLTGNAFDVIDFFSSPLVLEFEAGSDASSQSISTANQNSKTEDTNLETTSVPVEPPWKRFRAEQVSEDSLDHGAESGPYCSQISSRMWARIEALTSELMHLALRLHSVKEKPNDLPTADLQLWLGLASASVQATRWHRDRCVDFANSLHRFDSFCGACVFASSVAVSHACLLAAFRSLDHLLEGTIQARVFVEKLAASGDTHQQLHSLESLIKAIRSTLQVVRRSDEFRAHFELSEDGQTAFGSNSIVRVRSCFLENFITRARAVGQSLEIILGTTCASMPEVVKENLQSTLSDLLSRLDSLHAHTQSSENASDLKVSWIVLRSMLMTVQQSSQSLMLDPSVCARAIAGAEAGEAIDWDGLDPIPHLGIGRGQNLRSLLELLPINDLMRQASLHVEELPPCTVASPLGLFARQISSLGRAVLFCGLESAVATAEISLRLLWMVCFLLEHGLGTKAEEGGDPEDGDGDHTEWAAGTGMGDGDGLRDVTEEIKDDAQLEGTRGEKEEEKKKPDMPEEGKEDTAKEVGFDFDAEAQAVPEEKGDGQEPPDKEQDDELDRQTGEVDLGAGGKLDEKMWNGDDEEDKDQNDENQEHGKKQEEDIQAHGAQGEGEAETTAPDDAKEGEQKEKNEKPDKQSQKEHGQDENNAEPDADKAEEGGGGDADGENDAQFDVQMQPQGKEAGEGEGEGDGEGDGDAAGEDDLDLGEDDLNLDGGGGEEGDEDMDLDAKSEGQDEMDLDGVDAGQPQAADEANENDARDNAVDTCLEGEAAQSEDKGEEQKNTDPVQGQTAQEENKPAEQEPPPCQSDAKPTPKSKDSAAAQKAEEQVFGGSTGQATPFESQSTEMEADNAEASAQTEQGSMAPSRGAQQNSSEMPSATPDTGPSNSQRSQPSPQQDVAQEAQDRHLQKVDIVRDTGDGEVDASREQKEGAEKGLHMADQQSGADALGECRDQESVPNQAIGVSEQEGDDQGDEAPAMEEETENANVDSEKRLDSMAMQQMDDMAPDALNASTNADGAAPEEQMDPLRREAAVGSSPVTNIATVNLAAVTSTIPVDDASAEAMEVEQEEAKHNRRPEAECRELWAWLEGCTTPLAAALCEQLRTILEPTLKGRLQGFYRTGKRISMRRVIPFIASNYRRDKIWLRRTKPSKREYQIIVALDNTRSMNECGVGSMALQTLCTVCQALAQLEVGEYAVLAFGSSNPRVLLPLGAGQPHAAVFGWEQARNILAEFTFDEESRESHNRSLSDVLQRCSQLFEERCGSSPARPFCQVTLLISDGRFNKAKVRAWIHAALSQQQLPLLIIVDSNADSTTLNAKRPAASTASSRRSVFDLKQVSYEGGRCNVVPYLQDFPFPYYVVVQDLQALPSVLSDVLKQWFELAVAV